VAELLDTTGITLEELSTTGAILLLETAGAMELLETTGVTLELETTG